MIESGAWIMPNDAAHDPSRWIYGVDARGAMLYARLHGDGNRIRAELSRLGYRRVGKTPAPIPQSKLLRAALRSGWTVAGRLLDYECRRYRHAARCDC